MSSGPLLCQFVPIVSQGAFLQRKATATDASVQVMPQSLQSLNPFVEFASPIGSHSAPFALTRCTVLWQHIENAFDFRERESQVLSRLNECDHAQGLALETPLLTISSFALDQSLRLIEVYGGDSDARSL